MTYEEFEAAMLEMGWHLSQVPALWEKYCIETAESQSGDV